MSDAPDVDDSLHPVLPLRDVVIFPHMVAPLFVGREKSVRALEYAMRHDRQVALITQKNADLDDPGAKDLYGAGVLGTLLQMLKLPDGTMKVLVEGHRRVQVKSIVAGEDFNRAAVTLIPERAANSTRVQALRRVLIRQFEAYAKQNRKLPSEVVESIARIEDPSRLVDTIAQHLSLKISDRQMLLEMTSLSKRLQQIFAFLEGEIDVIQMEKRIRSRVKRQVEKTQKEYYLNEQMKAIQKELGEEKDTASEIESLKKRAAKAGFSPEAKAKFAAELKKLRTMPPMAAEATVVRNYLEWLLDVPWRNKKSPANADLTVAQKTLDDDHYGLEKVKERILEYLAVQVRMQKIKGPILCLVGPPGVGKTSLGRSIARATGREFVRVSLGGLRDESEIRGHRRTYIGAMPGRIIQGMKKAGVRNPVFLLDEIDKVGADWRGDPSSALLEVLDPEQNSTFNDHYLDVDYDLSDVLFITTANSLNMPQPLRDRMEIIRIAGYTEDEKTAIARRYLLPRQLQENGLKEEEFSVSDAAFRDLIRYYTREAGVRSLDREVASLCRKSIRRIMMHETDRVAVTPETLPDLAGVRRFHYGESETVALVGVVTGLAWTESGGELLSIEAVMVPGKGRVIKTGKLGEVMQESVVAADSYIKSRMASLGIDPAVFPKTDLHLHVPEGATPKDGPSAGVAMVTAMVSTLTGIAVRHDVAMTGEITLRGRVLQIGGLKEKLLAALRGGIKTVLIPLDNVKDLAEIPDTVKNGLEIVPVSTLDEVLAKALIQPLQPSPWRPEDGDPEKGDAVTAPGPVVATVARPRRRKPVRSTEVIAH